MIEEDKNRLSYRPSQAVTLQQVEAAERAVEKEGKDTASFTEFVSAGLEEDQILSYLFQDKEDFVPDEGWADELNADLYSELTDGLPQEYHDYLEDTVSLGHAKATRERIQHSLKNEQKMASWGWSGVPMRIALNIADPVAIVATAATEGVAAPLIWGGKATRIGRVVRGAVTGAATNAAIEGYIASQSETRDEYDVLYAATAGLILGGGLGAIPRKSSKADDPTIQAHENHARAVEQAQEADIAAQAKAELAPEADVVPTEIKFTSKKVPQIIGGQPSTDPRETLTAISDGTNTRYIIHEKDADTGNGYDEWVEVDEAGNALEKQPKFWMDSAKQRKDAIKFMQEEMLEQRTIDRSVGAAQNPLSPAPLMQPLRNGVDDLFDDLKTQESMFGNLRIDMVGRLLQSKNPSFNRLGQILGEDAVGARNGGTVTIESTADVLKTNIMKGTFSRFYKTYNIEYSDWVKQSKKGLLRKYRLTNRAEFGELVADAIERPDLPHHPSVKRMAQKNAELYADLLDQAKQSGVKGFENIPKNLTYFTHRWNKFKLHDMRQVHGDEAIVRLLKTGLIRGTQDLPEDAAEAIAKAMSVKIRSDTAGLDSGFSRIFTADGRDTLKQIMLEEKFGKIEASGLNKGKFKEFSEDEVDRLLDLFKQKETGIPSYAKSRLRFDMETEITSRGETLTLKQLQDRDAEQVFTLYGNELAGRIALAKKGIKSESDFTKMVNDGRAYAENEGGALLKGVNKEAEISQVMYNMILGRRPHPQYDPNSSAMKITRLIQDYNFLRLMGQVGWAQFAEIGNAYNVNGFKGILQVMPEYRRMLKRAKDGDLSDPVLRDIESFYGTGSDRMIQQMINRLDYIESGGSQVGGGKVGKFLNKAQVRSDQLKRVQADVSGMAPITLMLERGTARVVAQTLADLAHNNAKLSIKRLNSLGLDDDTAKMVFENIIEHGKFTDSALFRNKKIRELNLENWSPDAREAFGVALARWTRRTIQQNDVGNLSLFMTKPWGQVISQFRTFQIVSHSKQLLHNVSMNDTRAYLAMTFSAVTAGAAYVGQQNVKMIGMDKKKREEYAEENLSALSIAKAGFSRSSWSAFIPSTVDSVASFVADDPLFSYRTTGLQQNFLEGIPTVQAAQNLLTGVQGATQSASPLSKKTMTRGRARALASLLPFQNVTGIGNFTRLMADQFPERSGR